MKAFDLIVITALAAGTVQQQPDLQATLAKLDAASAKFSKAQAKVHRDAFTKFVQEHVVTDGSIYVIRESAGKAQFGLKTTGKDARTMEYKDGTIRVFNPGLGCYDTVTKPGIDTYLTLGFGGSGKDLASAWAVTDLGPETMGGTKVEKLELVAKDANVRSNFSKVGLWVDVSRDVSVQQVFYAPNGDTYTATYSEITTPSSVNTKPFEIKGKSCK